MALFRTLVLVDGFNLYHGVRQKHGRKYLWLNLEALAGSLLKPDQELTRLFFFTARVRDDAEAAARQGAYLGALRTLPRTEIVEGRFQEKSRECRKCGSAWRTYEEKESDVNVAVTLVEQAAQDAFDTALIISADSDLCPAIRSVSRIDASKRVVAAFPPKRVSGELRKAAYAAFTISDAKIRQSQFPKTVLAHDGRQFTQPPKWT